MPHWGEVIGENDGMRVIQCEWCGYAHQEFLPSEARLVEYYGNEYYNDEAGKAWFAKEEREHKCGYWNPAYADQLALLSGVDVPLVDVGCGAGWFMGYCWWHNKIAYGVEPSGIARVHSPLESRIFIDAREMSEGFAAWFAGRPVDIRMSLVLEHVREPAAMLRAYGRFMDEHPGGRLLVIVPNDFSPLERRLGTRHFIGRDHLNYFTPKSLWNLLVETGYRVVAQGATFPMELWQLAGVKYIGNDAVGKACHMRRLKFEKAFGARAFGLYRYLYRKFGWSRELVFAAERKQYAHAA